MLKRDEYKNVLGSAIEHMNEPEQAASFLTQASEEADELYTSYESAIAENTRLKESNKSLAKLNATLYLNKGVQNADPEEPTKPSIPTISDLFDEKGFLK